MRHNRKGLPHLPNSSQYGKLSSNDEFSLSALDSQNYSSSRQDTSLTDDRTTRSNVSPVKPKAPIYRQASPAYNRNKQTSSIRAKDNIKAPREPENSFNSYSQDHDDSNFSQYMQGQLNREDRSEIGEVANSIRSSKYSSGYNSQQTSQNNSISPPKKDSHRLPSLTQSSIGNKSSLLSKTPVGTRKNSKTTVYELKVLLLLILGFIQVCQTFISSEKQ